MRDILVSFHRRNLDGKEPHVVAAHVLAVPEHFEQIKFQDGRDIKIYTVEDRDWSVQVVDGQVVSYGCQIWLEECKEK